MKRTLAGAQAGPARSTRWEGSSKVGAGRMEVKDAPRAAKVVIQLDFIRPFEATTSPTSRSCRARDATHRGAAGTMRGAGAASSCKLMGVFADTDKMIGKDFEAGRANLKAAAEKLTRRRARRAARRAGAMNAGPMRLTPIVGRRAVRSGHLLDAGDRPLAAAVGRLDEVPDLVERRGDAVLLLADQAVEADADDLRSASVSTSSTSASMRTTSVCCAARRAPAGRAERREHLRRREGAQVVQVAGCRWPPACG